MHMRAASLTVLITNNVSHICSVCHALGLGRAQIQGGGVTAGFETVVSTSGKDFGNHEPCIDAVVITTAITDYDIFGAGQ